MSRFSFDRKPTSAPDAALRADEAKANEQYLQGMRDAAMQNLKTKGHRLQLFWTLRGQVVAFLAGAAVGVYFMVYPFMAESFKEILSYSRATEPAQNVLPAMSVSWWENAWRKGIQTWRAGENEPGFYHDACNFILECTGKEVRRPFETFGYNPAKASDSVKRGEWWNREEAEWQKGINRQEWKLAEWEAKKDAEEKMIADMVHVTRQLPNEFDMASRPTVKREFRRVSKFENDTSRPRAFVPMCGDSPIVKELALMGYNTDGVDAVELAIATAAENTERALIGWNEAPLHRVHYHYSDVFEPALWKTLPKHGFDLIWDRQGLSAIDPEVRDDYSFILKRALKPSGVLYVEGTYRTKRVHQNRHGGPPFHFGKKELAQLFPITEGYMVKCREMKELERSDLSPENRVVGVIPKELRVRQYPCVVWKDEVAAKKEMEKLHAEAY